MHDEIIHLDIATEDVEQDRTAHRRGQQSGPDFLACLGNAQLRILVSPTLLTAVWQDTLQVEHYRPQPELQAWMEQWAEYRDRDDAPQPAGPAVIDLHPDGTAQLRIGPETAVKKLSADNHDTRPDAESRDRPC